MQPSARLTTAILALTLACAAGGARAQWRVQESHTTADLSGVYAVDDSVAWASGANGAVLRTLNGGRTWQACSAPANLDLGAVQGFDDKTAVVMSTGKGEASRLYKTTDGCQTWKQVLANPSAAGAFRALHRASAFDLYLLGDPVGGRFVLYVSHNAGDSWAPADDAGLAAPQGGKAAAGGGEAIANVQELIAFGASGQGAPVYTYLPICRGDRCVMGWTARTTPLAVGAASVAGRNVMGPGPSYLTGLGTTIVTTLVAVGGDADKPDQGRGSAALSTDNGSTWRAADAPPGGYRSAIAFDGDRGRFIAVGPNGTDETVDDGLVWQALKPGNGDAANADRGWTALSLPFAVGPHGRIGRLSDSAPLVAAQNQTKN